MDRSDIINRLEILNLDKTQYWVVAGSAMVMHGFREFTHDIDLGCSTKLADELELKGHPSVVQCDGTRKILIGEDIELFENWCYGGTIWLNGIQVISVSGLIEMKRTLGREKDLRDIKLIDNFMRKKTT